MSGQGGGGVPSFADLFVEAMEKVARYSTAIERVRDLHQSVEIRRADFATGIRTVSRVCPMCDMTPYPCPTIRALDPPEPTESTKHTDGPTSTGDGTSP